jgi:tape measure domain-containing protein
MGAKNELTLAIRASIEQAKSALAEMDRLVASSAKTEAAAAASSSAAQTQAAASSSAAVQASARASSAAQTQAAASSSAAVQASARASSAAQTQAAASSSAAVQASARASSAAQTQAASDAAKAAQKSSSDRAAAYRTMYSGIQGYSLARYKYEMGLLESERRKFVAATGDRLTADRYYADQKRELDKKLQGSTESLGRATNTVSDLIKKAAAAFALYKIAGFAGGMLQLGVAADSMRRSLAAATGGAKEAADAETYLREQSERLGLVFTAQAQGYQKIAAAARGTTLEGEKTRDIWLAVAEAGTALQLSSDEVNGALLAVSQMISKGRVSAEALRGQLGERLPGAMQAAADAMGMTQAAFAKALDTGQILAEDFLPRFAVALRERFADSVESSANSAQANINRLENTWWDLRDTVMNSGVLTAVSDGVNEINGEMKTWLDANRDLIAQAVPIILDGTKAVLSGLVEVLKTGAGLMRHWSDSWKAWCMVAGGALTVTDLLTDSNEALGAKIRAFEKNPGLYSLTRQAQGLRDELAAIQKELDREKSANASPDDLVVQRLQALLDRKREALATINASVARDEADAGREDAKIFLDGFAAAYAKGLQNGKITKLPPPSSGISKEAKAQATAQLYEISDHWKDVWTTARKAVESDTEEAEKKQVEDAKALLSDLAGAWQETWKNLDQATETTESIEARSNAMRGMYGDLKGFSTAAYDLELSLLKKRRQDYALLTGDKLASDTWYFQQKRQLDEKALRESGNFFDGVRAGYMEMQDAAVDWGDAGYATARAMFSSTADAFSDILYDGITGELKSLSDYWDAVWKSMLRAFVDVLGKMAAAWAASKVAGLFGLSGGGGIGLGGSGGGARGLAQGASQLAGGGGVDGGILGLASKGAEYIGSALGLGGAASGIGLASSGAAVAAGMSALSGGSTAAGIGLSGAGVSLLGGGSTAAGIGLSGAGISLGSTSVSAAAAPALATGAGAGAGTGALSFSAVVPPLAVLAAAYVLSDEILDITGSPTLYDTSYTRDKLRADYDLAAAGWAKAAASGADAPDAPDFSALADAYGRWVQDSQGRRFQVYDEAEFPPYYKKWQAEGSVIAAVNGIEDRRGMAASTVSEQMAIETGQGLYAYHQDIARDRAAAVAAWDERADSLAPGYWDELAARYRQDAYSGESEGWRAILQNAPAVRRPDYSFADGGVINEHVMGVGLRSGKTYQLGENGPERVIPGAGTQSVTINLHLDQGVITTNDAAAWLAGVLRDINARGVGLPVGTRGVASAGMGN